MNKDEEQEKSEGGIVVKCRKNSFLKLFVLWGMLVAGHLSEAAAIRIDLVPFQLVLPQSRHF